MKSLIFQNEEALRVALTSELIPVDVQAAAVRGGREADGSIWVSPPSSLPRPMQKALLQAGVRIEESGGGEPRDVSCWAELVAPRRIHEPDAGSGTILFVVPDGTSLIELAAEMLRLGCDRQEYRFLGADRDKGVPGPAALLRVIDPPYYSVVCALDRVGGLRAYVPIGTDGVWCEIGHAHPLADKLRAPRKSLLLIPGGGEGWLSFEDGAWADVYQLVDVELRGKPRAFPVQSPPRRLEVQLRLGRSARAEAPSLWVLRQEAVRHIDALVQTLPDDVVARVLFAVTDGGAGGKGPVVILKARLGREGPPELVVPGEAYAPLLQIPNLFVPCDAIVEPPLRRDKLRQLVAPNADRITWLAPSEPVAERGFRVESIADAAFAPLMDWVDYLVHSEASELEPWVRSATFDFAAFESIGGEWTRGGEAPAPEEPQDKGKKKKRREPRATEAPVETREVRREEPEVIEMEAEPEITYAATTAPASISADEETLQGLERAFLDSDAPADDPRRLDQWLEMGELNARLRRRRDAGLAYTRTLWELEGPRALDVARRWAGAEARALSTSLTAAAAASAGAAITALVALPSPTRDETRALASQVVASALSGGVRDLHSAQLWLDRHDDNLDVRSLWLVRQALAQLAGGDRLGLARTRDRILAKLHRGLSIERDVPTFLRFCGGGAGAGRDSGTVARLSGELDGLLGRYVKAKRTRSAIEAPPALTQAYVELLFAYGTARLGHSDKARALRDQAIARLDVKDQIHGLLARAYSARIEHALEGLPHETPLPAELAGELNALERFSRYKVDRLRQASTVLEPQERLDPIRGFQTGGKDPRGEEFAAMRGMAEGPELASEVDRLMKVALSSSPFDDKVDSSLEMRRARLFDGLMDFFPMLPEAQAVPHLETLTRSIADVPAPRRADLLEEALTLGGHFGREEIIRPLLAALQQVIKELGPEHADKLAKALKSSLRTLRRVGLREEATELLDRAAQAQSGKGTAQLDARIQLAGGLAYLGRMDRAQPVFAEAEKALDDATLTGPDRLKLSRSFADAVAHATEEYALAALGRLGNQLVRITDSFNTNSHFCLSVVSFMEALVLGLASEDLALGELGRRWLDEDEYLVRRRIHRDLTR